MTRKPLMRRKKTGNIRPTQRDPKILLYMDSRGGLAKTSDILREFPDSNPKHLKGRLRQLFDHEILDRPIAQLHDFTGFGTPELIHAIGNRGAEILAEIRDTVPPKTNLTDRNRSIKYRYLKHTLRVGDFDDAINRTPRCLRSFSIIPDKEILRAAPRRTQLEKKPLSWRTRIRLPNGSVRPVTTVPDRFFGLDHTVLRKRFYFIGEIDRATEPNIRTKQKNTQTWIGRKFQSYLSGYHSNLHQSRFNIGNIRFLFVTTSQDRIQNMLSALSEMAQERDVSMFYFADFHQLTQADNIMAVPWINGHGNRAALIS